MKRLVLALGLLTTGGLATAIDSRAADSVGEIRTALQQLERGARLSATQQRRLAAHPLYAYLEYAGLARRLDAAKSTDVHAFFSRHADLAIVETLRTRWLQALARRGEWRAFLADWMPQTALDLRCHHAQARWATGAIDAELHDQSRALWLNGQSLPAGCDALFASIQKAGLLDAELRWQRILLAAENGQASLMRYLGKALPAADAARAKAFADFIEHPSEQAKSWPRDGRSAQMASIGLRRFAQRDVDSAGALLATLAAPLGMRAEDRDRVLYAIALWSAASYKPETAARMAAVPAMAFDARLHEWRVRDALARADWKAASAAVAAMPKTQRAELRWRYLAARLLEVQGQRSEAIAIFTQLAKESQYFGFLAADRLQQDYALCPLDVGDDRGLQRQVAGKPKIQRALLLHALDRDGWALPEWQRGLAALNSAQRREAVRQAIAAGWTDRAVFDLGQGEDLRYYTLRFPLAHRSRLDRESSKRDLDPAWVAALIRAESAWQPKVRSHADALGLMQLLPGVAADTARGLGLRWGGRSTLFQPDVNITLGTAHLAEMMQRHADTPMLATAAYNAGPTPVARWRHSRPLDPPDLWVETIPYFETRDYVARIMAFSVIYDWRLGRKALPVTDRLLGRTDDRVPRRGFFCPSDRSVDAASG